ncbi:hypothetical protein [Peribacillus muralis]|uniref:hypothetical protein n=1 Tax=Peribacillus muralis TaxID=264697 RepID=UPI0036701C80
MKHLIGRDAFKNRGYFSGLVGVITENPEGHICPYKLVSKSGININFRDERDITLLPEGDLVEST